MMSAKERTGTNGNEGIVGRIDVESPKKGFESGQSKSSCIMGSSLSSPASRHINHKKKLKYAYQLGRWHYNVIGNYSKNTMY